jgi:tetratricopeptide (TPR) repeat protein
LSIRLNGSAVVATTVLLGAIVMSGCATHREATVGSALEPQAQATAPGSPSAPASRQRTTRAFAQMLEATDRSLMTALAELARDPSAQSHRRVAQEYVRLHVLDLAHEHFTEAVLLNPTDATSYDALARIWRDWGVPQLGLGDAYRAVHYAPDSAEAANTLGTLLQSVRQMDAARHWYMRALMLEPRAWYAVNNLCYLDVLTRQHTAVTMCQQAVAASGEQATARNNLALAYAASGDLVGAKQWFRRANDPATANYNYGIVLMALRKYAPAAMAFEAALNADPEFTLAAARARQAWKAVLDEERNP